MSINILIPISIIKWKPVMELHVTATRGVTRYRYRGTAIRVTADLEVTAARDLKGTCRLQQQGTVTGHS